MQFKEITQIWQRQNVCTFKKGFSVLVVTAVSDDPNCRLLLTKQFGNCTCWGWAPDLITIDKVAVDKTGLKGFAAVADYWNIMAETVLSLWKNAETIGSVAECWTVEVRVRILQSYSCATPVQRYRTDPDTGMPMAEWRSWLLAKMPMLDKLFILSIPTLLNICQHYKASFNTTSNHIWSTVWTYRRCLSTTNSIEVQYVFP